MRMLSVIVLVSTIVFSGHLYAQTTEFTLDAGMCFDLADGMSVPMFPEYTGLRFDPGTDTLYTGQDVQMVTDGTPGVVLPPYEELDPCAVDYTQSIQSFQNPLQGQVYAFMIPGPTGPMCLKARGATRTETSVTMEYQYAQEPPEPGQGMPDLVVTGINAPSTVSGQGEIMVSWTVANQGDGEAAGGGWEDQLYFSTNDVLEDWLDSHLISYRRDMFLAAGANYTSDGSSVWIPYDQLPAGATSFYLLLKTDSSSNVPESNEENNVYVHAINIQLADLVLTSVEVPSAISSQQEIAVSWTVTNQGDGEAASGGGDPAGGGGWEDAVFLSTDDVFQDWSDFHLMGYHRDTPLPPGASYTGGGRIWIPNDQLPAGATSFYLLVRADGWDNIKESNEDNNIHAQLVTIESPDLAVTGVDAPSSIGGQGEFTVSWTVTNQGDGQVDGGWEDAVYLSTDDVFDEWLDIHIASYHKDGPLATGASYQGGARAWLPENLPEATSYYLLIRTDSWNNINESDKANNVYAVPVAIAAQTPADLMVTTMTSTEVSTNQEVTVSWTVMNQGEGEARGGWEDKLYLSTDEFFNEWMDVHIADYRRDNPVPAGATYVGGARFWIPNEQLPAGTSSFYFIVKVDNWDNVPESDKENNVYAQLVTIESPDLTVTSMDAPSAVTDGVEIGAAWTVTNQGDGEAKGGWDDNVYLSRDAILNEESDMQLASYHRDMPLPGGASYQGGARFWPPYDQLSDGMYYLLVKTDSWNNVPESHEGNNIYVHPITIGQGGQEEVSFPDPNLEAAIRQALNKPTEPIKPEDLAGLIMLAANERGIADLAGIERCSNVESLDLFGNDISDVGPLGGLINLQQTLDLGDNRVADIGPLSNLTKLRELLLDGNQIDNISPLSGLTELNKLELADNQISDISPLVNNMGLGAGDEVDLQNNPLDDDAYNTHIPALQARGVNVLFTQRAGDVPARPSNLVATAISASQIDLSWDAGTGPIPLDGYEIERMTEGGSAEKIGTTAAMTYSDTDLQPDTTYIYRVRAYNSNGSSSWSDAVAAETLAGSGWTVTLTTTSTDSSVDPIDSIIGASPDASDGFDTADVPLPPRATPPISLDAYIEGTGAFSRLSEDHREEVAHEDFDQTWTFLAYSDEAEFNICWDGSSLPEDLNATITQVEPSGPSANMSAQSCFDDPFSTGVEYSFSIHISPPAAWNIVLTTTSTGEGIDPIDCVVGAHPNASDEFDSKDVPLPPRGQPPISLDAYIEGTNPSFSRLSEDFREEVAHEEFNQTWTFLAYSDEAEFNINWDASNLPADLNATITQVDPAGPSLDIHTESGFDDSFSTGVEYSFTIHIGQGATLELNLSAGWNMVSCPGDPVISEVSELLSGTSVLPVVYTWDSASRGYAQVDTLEFGVGYWFGAIEDTQLAIDYQPRSSVTCQVEVGWNMVGSVSGNVPVEDLTSDPDGVVLPIVYGWNPDERGYTRVEQMEPGGGYWVGAISEAALTIDSTAASAAPAALEPARPSWESVIAIQTRITSSNIGALDSTPVLHQELVFGMHPSASGRFDRLLDRPIPPVPATSSNEMKQWVNDTLKAAWVVEDPHFSLLDTSFVGDSSHASWELSVELPEPGELQWRHLPTAYRCSLHYDGQVIQMQRDGAISLPAGEHSLRLVLDAFDALPKRTQLLANYPNPCNPETWIPYQLKEDTHVAIKIYTSTGQLVRILDLGYKPAGFYVSRDTSAHWDGRNASGESVVSGIYFYTVQAGDFAAVRKLTVLK
jgi:Leucine-rich repeat (LRR) protein